MGLRVLVLVCVSVCVPFLVCLSMRLFLFSDFHSDFPVESFSFSVVSLAAPAVLQNAAEPPVCQSRCAEMEIQVRGIFQFIETFSFLCKYLKATTI